MLELKSISKKFSSEIFTSFSYKFENNIYFLRGNNGSGKTTLLKIIKGIYICDSGELILDHEKNQKDDVAYIDSNPRTFFHRLTVKQNLEYFSSIHNKNNDRKTQVDILNMFNLSNLLHKNFSSLSQGQMQLISLVRGLSSDPSIILLDEVFSSLDEHNKKILFKYISKFILRKKSLVIFTSHEDNYDDMAYKELCLS